MPGIIANAVPEIRDIEGPLLGYLFHPAVEPEGKLYHHLEVICQQIHTAFGDSLQALENLHASKHCQSVEHLHKM